MKLLLSNDDGWDAPGLALLAEVARQFGEVWVVAPQRPQSGISHQLTLDRPMEMIEQRTRWFSLDGTPADCARVAIHQLGESFDCVLSGINHGANLGSDVFVSGTVAAAREAHLMGLPAIALSQYHRDFSCSFDWHRIASVVRGAIERTLEMIGEGGLVNINLPDRSIEDDWDEIEMIDCPLDLSPLPFEYRTTESSAFVYAGDYHQRQRVPGKDVDVCFQGKISITRMDGMGSPAGPF